MPAIKETCSYYITNDINVALKMFNICWYPIYQVSSEVNTIGPHILVVSFLWILPVIYVYNTYILFVQIPIRWVQLNLKAYCTIYIYRYHHLILHSRNELSVSLNMDWEYIVLFSIVYHIVYFHVCWYHNLDTVAIISCQNSSEIL